MNLFLSFDGRIPRSKFWIGLLVLVVLNWVLMAIAGAVFGTSMMMSPDAAANPEQAMQQMSAIFIPMMIVLLILLYPSLAVYTKRWHDRGKSGWWSLIMFIPIAGFIWMIVELGILRGTDGDNKYGPDPLA